MLCIEQGYWRHTLFFFLKIDLIVKIIMLRIELVYDWMCDMSSCVDVINNKSIMRFWWFVIILQD